MAFSERDPQNRGGLSPWFDKYDALHNPAAHRRPDLPGMNFTARATKALKVTSFSEDKEYRRFLIMLEHGIPLAAVWDKCIAAGLDPKMLLNDPDGPAKNQKLRDPKKEAEDEAELFLTRMQNEPWKAHAADWNQMQRSSLNLRDAALLPRTVGLAAEQRLQRRKQNDIDETRRGQAAPGEFSELNYSYIPPFTCLKHSSFLFSPLPNKKRLRTVPAHSPGHQPIDCGSEARAKDAAQLPPSVRLLLGRLQEHATHRHRRSGRLGHS